MRKKFNLMTYSISSQCHLLDSFIYGPSILFHHLCSYSLASTTVVHLSLSSLVKSESLNLTKLFVFYNIVLALLGSWKFHTNVTNILLVSLIVCDSDGDPVESEDQFGENFHLNYPLFSNL